jgi:hypothetical protein
MDYQELANLNSTIPILVDSLSYDDNLETQLNFFRNPNLKLSFHKVVSLLENDLSEIISTIYKMF